ncbi:conserved hypothetical protein [Candidatus Desulfarcum epimagneticum]|uniref:Beta-lactamase-related domain-containing protein n=1 Tax=uncultured Desulfobacteraceae bacterium TaxID=218296 RepID=A0A484HEE9_9BACT|nr:conserved hypothetical protein [uncultured Desulfobacteraceae bacterium]
MRAAGNMETVRALMARAVSEKVFPGGVFLASRGGDIRFFESFGVSDIFSRRPVSRETVFDLASLTKPLATALGVMALIRDGKLDMDQELGSVLSGFQKRGVSIRRLLAHTSGLAAWRPYHRALMGMPAPERKEALTRFLFDEPLAARPGRGALYSDLGFMLLSRVVEAVSERRLDRFVHDAVYAPLGVRGLFFVDIHSTDPDGATFSDADFAATEFCPWRKTMLKGEVHDDNAWAAGGIEGHAGLFGDALPVHRLLGEILSVFSGKKKSAVFERRLLEVFFEKQAGAGRALGFDMPSGETPGCGRRFSKNSLGHLGFTGTSFWMDPAREVIAILLTNRVHPSRENTRIKAFRPKIHDALMKAMGV